MEARSGAAADGGTARRGADDADAPPPPATFDGLLFDLDGTLIDSAPDIAAAINAHFDTRGWPRVTPTMVERFLGKGPRRLLADTLAAQGLPTDDATVEASLAAYVANYARSPVRHTRFHPHVEADLRALRAAGFRLGICTNKPHALTERILEALGIAPLFDAALGADAVPACKPDPGHLLALAARMGLSPGRWAYIGDTDVDRAAAEAAGGPFFVVPWGGGAEVAVAAAQRIDRLLDLMIHRPGPDGRDV